jgi:hypothetical protein
MLNKVGVGDNLDAIETTRFRSVNRAKEFIAGLRNSTIALTGYHPADMGTEITELLQQAMGNKRTGQDILIGVGGLDVSNVAIAAKSLKTSYRANVVSDALLAAEAEFQVTSASPGISPCVVLYTPHGSGSFDTNEAQSLVFTDCPASLNLVAYNSTADATSAVFYASDTNATIKARLESIYTGQTITVSGSLTTSTDSDTNETLYSGTLTLSFGTAADVAQVQIKCGEQQKLVVASGDDGNYTWNAGANFAMGATESDVQTNQRALAGSYANVVVKGQSSAPVSGSDSIATKSAVLPSGRYGSSAAYASNGKIYVFGGGDNSGTPVNMIYEYDPVTDSITTKTATLPSARLGTSAVTGSNGKIYIFGGYESGGSRVAAITEYDPTTDATTVKTGALASSCSVASAALGSNGKIYVFGGDTSGSRDKISEYDPTADALTVKSATLPAGRSNTSAALASNGKIYVFGGGDNSGNPVNMIYEYDPVTDSITTKTATLPSARLGTSAVTGSNGKIYIFGGYLSGGTKTDAILEYDPVADSITTKSTVMPAVRQVFGAAITSAGKAYIFGGDGASVLDTIVEYTLPSDGTPSSATFNAYFPYSVGNVADPATTGTGATSSTVKTGGSDAGSVAAESTTTAGYSGEAVYNVITATGNGTSVNDTGGATATTNGAEFILQAVGTGSVTCKIQHAPDSSGSPGTWADLTTFDAITGTGSTRKSIASGTSVNPWLRLVVTAVTGKYALAAAVTRL